MKRILVLLLLLTTSAMAGPLSSVARSVIPKDVQQIIVVDYRGLNNSPTAVALKNKVMPQPLVDFEKALKGVGVVPDRDVDQLVFAMFRFKDKTVVVKEGKDAPQDPLRLIGIAQGQFAGQKLSARLVKEKIKGKKYRTYAIYPMANGLSMVLIDDFNMVFGFEDVLKSALDVYDGVEGRSLNTNTAMTDQIAGVDSDTIWSVLDTIGTQTMLRSALGDAAGLADYESVKNRLQGSRYGMTFNNGVELDLRVTTSDVMSAGALASLLKIGVSYRKSKASETEKSALEGVTVSSDSRDLKVIFKANDAKFKDLLGTDLFAAVSK